MRWLSVGVRASGPALVAVRAGPVATAALLRAAAAALPHYPAAGFDVVCAALPALLQPVALPAGHCSSCQQVSTAAFDIPPPPARLPSLSFLLSSLPLSPSPSLRYSVSICPSFSFSFFFLLMLSFVFRTFAEDTVRTREGGEVWLDTLSSHL